MLDYLEYADDLAEAAAFFWDAQRYDLVRACSDRLLRLNRRSVAGHYWKSAWLDQQARVPEALEALKVVYYQSPNYRNLSNDLPRFIQILERPQGVYRHRAQLGCLLALSPRAPLQVLPALFVPPEAPRKVNRDFLDVPSLLQSADFALKKKRLPDAEGYLKQVLREDPENAAAHEILGKVYEARGLADRAAAHYARRTEAYRAEVRENPGDATLCNNFAWFLAERRLHRAEALRLARRAVDLDPDSAASLDTLAELLFQDGQLDEAIRLQKQAAELEPNDDHYTQQLRKFEAARKPAPGRKPGRTGGG